MKRFTNLFSLQKTLRFELIPQGETMEMIERHGIIKQDEHRSESYKEVKKIIDNYHKFFINDRLSNFHFDNSPNKNYLRRYYDLYLRREKTMEEISEFKRLQDKLREEIVTQLTECELYKKILGGKLIREILPKHKLQEKEKALIEEFEQFTTYFSNFWKNRENIYSKEAKSTAIAYRLIHENLPKFIDNIQSFGRIASTSIADSFTQIVSELEEYLNIVGLEEVFTLDYFNMVLTQSQIDVYNTIIGGKTFEDGRVVKGLNGYINEYNQQHSEDRLPLLKPLYKQILSDREAISWLPESFETDKELLLAIKEFYESHINAIDELSNLVKGIRAFNSERIYIVSKNGANLSQISQKVYSNWNTIKESLLSSIQQQRPQRRNEDSEKYKEIINKNFKSIKSFSLNQLSESAGLSDKGSDICSYFETLSAQENLTHQEKIHQAYEALASLLEKGYPKEKKISQDKDAVGLIKALLDAILNFYHFITPLSGSGEEPDKDEMFYGIFSTKLDELSDIVKFYDKVRNYLTKKPYSLEKIKLNFENSTLLQGWDENKEKDNSSVLLLRDGYYYLAIMARGFNKIFEEAPSYNETQGECYEKIIYKLLPDPKKMLPKVFFAPKNAELFNPSSHILEIRKKESFKTKKESFNIDDCHTFIDFYKDSIKKHKDWSKFGFRFSQTEKYSDINEFYNEVESQGYRLTFRKISAAYIEQCVDEGKLFLFKIHSKDFSKFSKGVPNIHTLYWKALFDKKNLENVFVKLNGQAEIFFRKKSLKADKPTHPAGLPINNKNPLRNKKESVFQYDIYKNRRFLTDKIEFHVPITLNFKSKGLKDINDVVCDYIKANPDIHFIGIDRGERHLLYVTVIDSKGVIKEQFSLNIIENEYKGERYTTDYKELLSEREAKRDEERKSWTSIESIKELKSGYLSQAIHKITQLMIKYNAIVVLENLNKGFKQLRQKVERAVYQKFEKMLIDKLNYLADKRKPIDEEGGILKAYQLTNPFTSFKNMEAQNGFIFYVPAWNTSNIDPVTGFVNLFDTRVKNAQEFFKKFDSIKYNEKRNYYEFSFDYKNFTTRAEKSRRKWVVCSYGTRVQTFQNPDKNSEWDSKEVDLTNEYKSLFIKYNINEKDLKSSICTQSKKSFFEDLLKLFRLTLQMRNSISRTDIDYILSPVYDENEKFFDSRSTDDSLPKNADANGAFNIARKGLWVAMQIKKANSTQKVNTLISNQEWLNFAQEKPYLSKD